MHERRYSRFVYLISIFFAFIYFLSVYLSNSHYWILIGSSFISTFLLFIYDDKMIGKFSRSIFLSSRLQICIYFLLIIIYLYSSISGMFLLINKIALQDSSLVIMPISIAIILILGTIIGMFQKLIQSVNYH